MQDRSNANSQDAEFGKLPACGAPFKPLAVTFSTAKQISGLGMTTLWSLAKARRIEVVRVGRRTLIRYSSLEKLLAGCGDPRGTNSGPPRRGRPRKMQHHSAAAS
jgi:hypothetical protein